MSAQSEHPLTEADYACGCGHDVQWHHDKRGCGYHGYVTARRCLCPMAGWQVVAAHRAEVEAERDAVRRLLDARTADHDRALQLWREECDRSEQAEAERDALAATVKRVEALQRYEYVSRFDLHAALKGDDQ